MRRSIRRRQVKSIQESTDSESEEVFEKSPPKKKKISTPQKTPAKNKTSNKDDENSSSESDIENYLQPVNKIDLSAPFFNLQKDKPENEKESETFDKIEKGIFSDVRRLSDSESEEENEKRPKLDREIAKQLSSDLNEAGPSTSSNNVDHFKHLHDFAKKIEQAKHEFDKYESKRKSAHKETSSLKPKMDDIFNLLNAGESKLNTADEKTVAMSAGLEGSLHSSDFESCSEDEEKKNWQEVNNKEKNEKKDVVPKGGIQITIENPGVLRKKKGVDLMAAMRRRFNRIKKENQVLVHKVHVLCWIAHGNYVNSVINSQSVLSVALSLLPSQQCYPPDRTDLKYLEQIVTWYSKAVRNVNKPVPQDKSLDDLLEQQMQKKEAYNKRMLVFIFVAVIRALGIQCRLVFSFQVKELRPPSYELLSEKNTTGNKGDKAKKPVKGKAAPVKDTEDKETKPVTAKAKTRSKSTGQEKNSDPKPKLGEGDSVEKTVPSRTRAKSSNSQPTKTTTTKSNTEANKSIKNQAKKPVVPKSPSKDARPRRSLRGKPAKEVPQLDGAHDMTSSDSDDDISQIDGADDGSPSPSKPNLKKLKDTNTQCPLNKHKPRLRKSVKYRDTDSEDDHFKPKSPSPTKRSNESPQKPNLRKLSQASSSSKLNGNSPPKKTALKKAIKYKDSDSDEESASATKAPAKPNLRKLKKSNDVRDDIVKLVKSSIKEQKEINNRKTVKRKSTAAKVDDDNSDYAPDEIQRKDHENDEDFGRKTPVKKRVDPRKVISSDSDDTEESLNKKRGIDVWAEVFLESEEKWISVDVVKGRIHCVAKLHDGATQPIRYIVAWNNNQTLKDVTRRYCTNFSTITRKLRADAKWFEASLAPFVGIQTAKDREEDDDLERQQLDQPLPKSIAEFKNHPLYVLKRHLLKFEAIYPADAPTLGFVRGEAVYSRKCVYQLHSRDIWLKSAKVVKPGEKPYKIVKARPKWDKLSNTVITDQLLEIFGTWQTEDYVPPTAENGIVPRNAFGNVELFKDCMLPKKTVHLKLPGLNKVARRLNIDCASAIVGFDFHSGWSHPTYDGFVVCEEFADKLVKEWELEQDEIEKREQEKLDKRVYGNWKKLIKGLLIREKLKAKYEFGVPSSSEPKGKEKKKSAAPKFSTKKK